MAYYQEIFGADHLFRIPLTEDAANELGLIDSNLEETTMHGGFQIMGTQILCSDDFMNQPQHATNIAIMLDFDADDRDDAVTAETFFTRVANSQRVRVTAPYAKAYFSGKRGEFTDEYGVNWIVSCRPHDWVTKTPVLEDDETIATR
ncbi:VOC family protein [Furfurilactobacillus sp. WILCCON 0119]